MGRQAGKASAYARTILAVRAPYWGVSRSMTPSKEMLSSSGLSRSGFHSWNVEQSSSGTSEPVVRFSPLEEDTLRDVYAVGHGSESASGARVFGRHPLPRPVRQFQVLFPGNRLERVDLRGIQPGFVQDGIAQPFGIVGIVGFYGIAA